MQPFAGVGKEVVGHADRPCMAARYPHRGRRRPDGARRPVSSTTTTANACTRRPPPGAVEAGSDTPAAGSCGQCAPSPDGQSSVLSVAAVPLPVAGAQLMCSFGVADAFMVTPEGKTLFENKPAATIMDNVPFKNIMPFGVCTSLANPVTAAQTAAALRGAHTGCVPAGHPGAMGFAQRHRAHRQQARPRPDGEVHVRLRRRHPSAQSEGATTEQQIPLIAVGCGPVGMSVLC